MVETRVVVVIIVSDGAKFVVLDVLNPSQVLRNCFEDEVVVLVPPGFGVEGFAMLVVVGVMDVHEVMDTTGTTSKVPPGVLDPDVTEPVEPTGVPPKVCVPVVRGKTSVDGATTGLRAGVSLLVELS